MDLFKDNPNKLVKNNHFWVFIGVLKISFTKVSGFEQDIDKDTFVEGGVNDAGMQLVVPKKERRLLRFERGLQTWSPVLTRMKPGVEIPLGITVIMMNDKNIPVHTYHAFDCIVTKWEVGDFDANTGTVLIETFEVSYTTCDRTNLQLI
jgi:phage tail-like protein